MSKSAIILALFVSIQMLGACGGQTGNGNTANTNTASANRSDPTPEGVNDNQEELGALVKLPFEPEEVAWKEISTADSRKLLAVIKFAPGDSKKVVEHAARLRPGEPVSIPSERWFPAELVSQSELSGDDQISATAYPADEFFQAPYTEGRLSRFQQSDFFILEMTAK